MVLRIQASACLLAVLILFVPLTSGIARGQDATPLKLGDSLERLLRAEDSSHSVHILSGFLEAEESRPEQLAIPNDQIDAFFNKMIREDEPGCVLGIIYQGEIVFIKGYGMANLEYGLKLQPNSVFHVASISKQFTAFAVDLLVSAGQVSWDDPVRKYLPEFPEYPWPVTLRHLVHHTSGIRDQWTLLAMAGWRSEADLITDDNVLDIIYRQQRLNFQPGTQYQYSNSGYTLLAAVVECVTGQTLREFTLKHIFAPLGMTNTHFNDDHQEIVANRVYGYRHHDTEGWKISMPDFSTVGPTGLLTTVEDMALWDRNLRDHLIGDASLYERFLLDRGILNNGDTLNYAHGLTTSSYRGQWSIGHDGADAGFQADYLRFPDLDLSIVCFCNFASAGPVGYTRRIARILVQDAFQPPAWETNKEEVPEIDRDRWAEKFQQLTGFYRDPQRDQPIRVWMNEGVLLLNRGIGGGARGALLVPMGEDRFKRWPGDQVVSFQLEGNIPSSFFVGQSEYNYLGLPVENVDVSPFLGNYWSEELDAEYQIQTDPGQADLILVHRVQNPSQYRCVFRDGFNSGSRWITFVRDEDGHISGFTYSDDRVWKLKFQRR
jgi:CubicO group peptidase (beta-lactamase class C family)